jgi:hypothetical protein
MSAQVEARVGPTRVSDLAGSSMELWVCEGVLVHRKARCYRFQRLCCDSREGELAGNIICQRTERHSQ